LPDFNDYSRIDHLVEVEEIESGNTEKLEKTPHEEVVMQNNQINSQINIHHMMGKNIMNVREKNPGISISWIPEDDTTDNNNIHHQDFEELHQLSGGMTYNLQSTKPTRRGKQKKTRNTPKRDTGTTATGQRKRRRWSDEEVEYLVEGIRLFGVGSWKDILNNFPFGDRTYVDLKDKFRNLRKKYSLEELLGPAVTDPNLTQEQMLTSSV